MRRSQETQTARERRWKTSTKWAVGIVALGSLLVCCLNIPGCTDSGDNSSTSGKPPAWVKKEYNVEIPTVEYHWDPAAGDSNVSAELGGPGFTGEGWQTASKMLAQGSDKAVRGGDLVQYIPDWPATLRQAGKDWNTSLNYTISDLCYESLLDIHLTTLEFVPRLASHWWISEDKMTYRYRINPNARFSDDSEVTAHDVVATYDLRMDETLLSPSAILTYGKLHRPVALSKYMVEVKAKKNNWRNFLYFSASLKVFPAKEVSIKGSEYLDKYEFAYTACSGPYTVNIADVVRGKSVTLTRRSDWWDDGNPAWTGLYNIDKLKFVVVKDPNLAFEKVKKGELDFFYVAKAQWWAEDIFGLDSVKRGLLVPTKFFNDAPIGTNGIAMNSSRPPLDDLRIRQALSHLLDRKTMIEKLYFNEYEPLDSYYQGGTYQNPNNKPIEYDELRAVDLLEKAGWTGKNANGYRVKGGKVLTLQLVFRTKLQERFLTIYQESCKKAGIKLDLQELTPAASWKTLTEKKYDLMATAWGALIFPNPETSFLGSLADKPNNNNVTAFKHPRVDELCKRYDVAHDVKERVEIVREIDGIVYNNVPYVLSWYNPARRIVYWNKFSMPKWGAYRTADRDQIFYSWWVDPAKEKSLESARTNQSVSLPGGDVENHFWPAWNVVRQTDKTASTATGNGSEG
jgi:microcin C transport system substrate-binding protein